MKRFVFASSCSMYGASDSDELLDEARPYGRVGLCRIEGACGGGARATRRPNFVTVSMRNATVYGASPRPPRHRAEQPRRLGAHDRSHSPALRWEVVASADPRPGPLARGARRARGAGRPRSGEAFNVGSADQNYLIRDLAEVLADVTGCEVEFASDASPDPRSYRVDFSARARVPHAAVRVGLPPRVRGARRCVPRPASDKRAVRGPLRPPATASLPPRHWCARGGTAVEREHAGVSSAWAMRFVPTPIAGVHLVELERHEDERGFFARVWCPRSSPRPD